MGQEGKSKPERYGDLFFPGSGYPISEISNDPEEHNLLGDGA